jgi:ferric-dicitrate binding protein FerR (iron transport regulator)
MKIDKDIFTELVLFEISGNIKESEKAELRQIIAEDAEAYFLYQELYAKYSAAAQEKIAEQMPAAGLWKTINGRRKTRRVKRVLAGAVVCSMIALLFVVRPSERNGLLETPLADNFVKLKTASGQIVNLSTTQGQINIGNVVLTNVNNTLSYSGNNSVSQSITLTTPPGRNFSLLLQDGTTVQLNSLTTIQFPSSFTGLNREVFVNGEAYFKIAKNEQKPFLVHLPKSTVKVLGTEFNVNTYQEDLSTVALVEGAVRVEVDSQSAIIKPGFETAFNDHEILSTTKFDEDDVLAWRQGIYLFHSASLHELATLIHRVYGVPVRVEPGAGSNKVFTGSMEQNKPIGNFLEGLKFSKYIDYSFDKDSVLTITQYK